MLTNTARVLLILPQGVLDRARVLAGRATTAFKLPVSLQIVLRVLLEEGLRRDHDPALLANIERQAKGVRQRRAAARRSGRVRGPGRNPSTATPGGGRSPRRRRGT